MQAMGLPSALALPAALFELLGGLAILVGFQTRIVALLLAGFCVVTAVIFHRNFADQIMMIMFMKNLAVAGGLLFVFSLGAGPDPEALVSRLGSPRYADRQAAATALASIFSGVQVVPLNEKTDDSARYVLWKHVTDQVDALRKAGVDVPTVDQMREQGQLALKDRVTERLTTEQSTDTENQLVNGQWSRPFGRVTTTCSTGVTTNLWNPTENLEPASGSPVRKGTPSKDNQLAAVPN